MNRRKKILLTALAVMVGLGLILAAFLAWTSFRVWQCDKDVFASAEIGAVPPHEFALLLGTSKMLGDWPNHYFTNRIEAAAALYHAGKVRKIIVSGDNRRAGYNEPDDMRLALLEKGVPDEAVLPDYAGFRTLDSVLRAKSVCDADSFIVVSQRFHCRRAIYLAKSHGLNAIGFEAKDVGRKWRYRRYAREILACAAAWTDVKLGRRPHFEK